MSDSQQHPGRPPEEPRDLRRVSVLLPPRLVSALDSAARAQGGATNRSDVIRTACALHLGLETGGQGGARTAPLNGAAGAELTTAPRIEGHNEMPETFDAVSAADAPAPETVFDQIRREAAEEQEQAADTAASPGEDPGTDAPVEPDWDSPAAAGTGEPAPQEYNR